MNEDYTFSVLKGIPIFCVNRLFEYSTSATSHIRHQYRFSFENGYSASVVEFMDWRFSGGQRYEILVNIPNVGGNDVERGDEKFIHRILSDIEQIGVDNIICIDNES